MVICFGGEGGTTTTGSGAITTGSGSGSGGGGGVLAHLQTDSKNHIKIIKNLIDLF